MIFLCIDPSIKSCGVAIFNNSKVIYTTLITTFSMDTNDPLEYMHKSAIVATVLDSLVEKLKKSVFSIVMEVPEYWNVKGFLGRESSALSKLNFVCGVIYGRYYGIAEDIHIYTPAKWKWQLPKRVIKNRLRNTYSYVSNYENLKDEIDAIGIGHFHIYGKI